MSSSWLDRIRKMLKNPRSRRLGIVFLGLVVLSMIRRKRSVPAGVVAAANNSVKQRMPFSSFLQLVESGQIGNVLFGYDLIEFVKKAQNGTAEEVFFTEPVRSYPGLVELLHEKKVPFDTLEQLVQTPPQSPLKTALMIVVPVVYFSLVGYAIKLLYDQNSGGDVGKLNSEKNISVSSGPAVKTTTFDDVAGIPKAREVVEEVADFLKNPERYTSIGARLPTGILLVGPPGTGKTMLARAMANEAGLPFFFCSGSDFVEIYAGRGAQRVRSLFQKASKAAPCVVFFDEIDALGKSRSADFSMNEEREQTLNQLLAAMDGFCSEKRVVVMAATNRYDVLDKALVRPGRFDRVVSVDPPDKIGREAILGVHTRHMSLAEDCDLGLVAAQTPGYTGAELAMICNEAAIRAARDKRKVLISEDFELAVNTHKISAKKGGFKQSMSGSDFVGQIFKGLGQD